MSTKRKSIWTRNLAPWLTLGRILGAGLLFVGIRSIHAGEVKTRGLHFQGAIGYVAGITLLLLAFLMLRGRMDGKAAPQNWTLPDKIVGILVALGLAACVVEKLSSSPERNAGIQPGHQPPSLPDSDPQSNATMKKQIPIR